MSAERRLQLSVGLIAAAVIGYEIGLVRLFSFLQHYHYTFLVVSGAVCGLGLGAALSAVLRVSTLHRHLGYWAGGCGVGMICGAFAVAQFPRMPLVLLVGIAGLPFIAAGAFLALAFRARYQQSQILYWPLRLLIRVRRLQPRFGQTRLEPFDGVGKRLNFATPSHSDAFSDCLGSQPTHCSRVINTYFTVIVPIHSQSPSGASP